MVVICNLIIANTYFDDKTDLSIKNTESTNSLLFSLITLLLVLVLFFMLKLRTRIDENGIQYKFSLFHFNQKIISWSDISKCYVRKYNPILEYGGWGMKGGVFFGKGNNVAYNVKGNIGLQMELKNGKKILIGTQKGNDIERVIATYRDKINNFGS